MSESMDEGRIHERAGRFSDAAKIYQRIVDKDPGNRNALKRLIMMYRRLKDFPGELSAIEAGLGTVAREEQSAQGKWLSANPQAAKLGKAMLQSLGGAKVSGYGTDPFVQQLLKRKDLVERKISGVKKTKIKPGSKRSGAGPMSKTERKTSKAPQTSLLRDKPGKAAVKKRQEETAKSQAKRATAAAKKEKQRAATLAAVQEKRDAAIKAKQEAAESKKAERAAARESKRRAVKLKMEVAKAAQLPSFFVITLRYLVPLTRIDGAMIKHVAFLEKYFSNKMFLMAGRQVPRTGGIIIARGKDRNLIDRIMRQDPFVKGKLASYDIVEFKASKTSKQL